MDLIIITNDPARARVAANAGIDRIMVDLELTGKVQRQGHLDTVISGHSLEDVARIKAAVPNTSLLVRTDPWPTAAAHIDAAIAAGADILMLPMFVGADDVAAFVQQVAGRAVTLLLLETPEAAANLDEVLAVPGVDEVHVGLNDLHLALRRQFMFELVADGTVARIGAAVLSAGVRFGFGGVARLGGGPLPAELVLSEHVRMGSTQVILSRDFHAVFNGADPHAEMTHEVRCLRDKISELEGRSASELEANAAELRQIVASIVDARARASPATGGT